MSCAFEATSQSGATKARHGISIERRCRADEPCHSSAQRSLVSAAAPAPLMSCELLASESANDVLEQRVDIDIWVAEERVLLARSLVVWRRRKARSLEVTSLYLS